MMVWVVKTGNKVILKGFDSHMRQRIEMTEIEDEWTIQTASGTYTINGQGCPDPVDFVMKLISPRREPTVNDRVEMPFLTFKNDDSGERWEVWEVR